MNGASEFYHNFPNQLTTYNDFTAMLRAHNYEGRFKIKENDNFFGKCHLYKKIIFICIYFPFWNLKKWREFKHLRKETVTFIEHNRPAHVPIMWKRTWFGLDIIKEIYKTSYSNE